MSGTRARPALSSLIVSTLLVGTMPASPTLTVSRSAYADQLEGFRLGQCLANWTGLVTEMDKVGDSDAHQTGPFYTREDWGKPDQPNVWSEEPSPLSPVTDFVFRGKDEVWGANDDTDIEYLYQHLLDTHRTSILKPVDCRQSISRVDLQLVTWLKKEPLAAKISNFGQFD